MRASYAFVLQKNNAEVSTYSVLTPTFIIEPKLNNRLSLREAVVFFYCQKDSKDVNTLW